MIRVEFIHSRRHAFRPREQAVVRRICDSVEVEVRALLPSLPLTVRLSVEDSRAVIFPEYGSTGSALDRTHVRWRVDAARPEGVLGVAQAHLRAVLFHELHHMVRGWVKRGPRATLMDGVVSEGLATTFERDAAGHQAPWGQYPSSVRAWAEELLALPDDASYAQWMFRHSDGRRWVGYRAGTFIVDLAMARARRSAAQLVNTPTAEILALAFPFN
jgi:hypothetical protein